MAALDEPVERGAGGLLLRLIIRRRSRKHSLPGGAGMVRHESQNRPNLLGGVLNIQNRRRRNYHEVGPSGIVRLEDLKLAVAKGAAQSEEERRRELLFPEQRFAQCVSDLLAGRLADDIDCGDEGAGRRDLAGDNLTLQQTFGGVTFQRGRKRGPLWRGRLFRRGAVGGGGGCIGILRLSRSRRVLLEPINTFLPGLLPPLLNHLRFAHHLDPGMIGFRRHVRVAGSQLLLNLDRIAVVVGRSQKHPGESATGHAGEIAGRGIAFDIHDIEEVVDVGCHQMRGDLLFGQRRETADLALEQPVGRGLILAQFKPHQTGRGIIEKQVCDVAERVGAMRRLDAPDDRAQGFLFGKQAHLKRHRLLLLRRHGIAVRHPIVTSPLVCPRGRRTVWPHERRSVTATRETPLFARTAANLLESAAPVFSPRLITTVSLISPAAVTLRPAAAAVMRIPRITLQQLLWRLTRPTRGKIQIDGDRLVFIL